MNPELSRNAWLELTPMRRWALPLTIVLVAFTALLLNPLASIEKQFEILAFTGLGLFAVFASLGSVKAMQTVTNEITGNTWDAQRLSHHVPREFLVGKLFGSTVFEWCGAGLSLLVFIAGRSVATPAALLVLDVVTLVGIALLLQAGGLFMSLASANAVRSTRRPGRTVAGQGVGLIVGLVMATMIFPMVMELITYKHGFEAVAWWLPVPLRLFVPLSVYVFLGWTVAGALRLIRAELQEPVSPAPWLWFLGFVTVYLYPLTVGELFSSVESGFLAFLATGAMVFGSTVLPLVLGERKDVVRLRTLAAAWVRGDRIAVRDQLPLWTYTLAGFALWVLALGVASALFLSKGGLVAFVFGLGVLALLLRDVGIVMAVHLAARPSREPGMVVGFYMVMLYAFAPFVASVMGVEALMILLFPPLAALPMASVGVPLSLAAGALGASACAVPWVAAVPRVRAALKAADG